MENLISFGQWVKRRRKALDLTQEDLARHVGCSKELIAKIEGDARRPSKDIAARLAVQLQLAAAERADFIRCARAELAVERLPPPVQSVPRAAFVPAVHAPPGPALETPGATPTPRTNLPAPTTPLLGRAQETVAVCALLRRPDVRLVTLTGAGGTGKTRLALEVARQLQDQFVDGVYVISLASISDPALVAPTIAQTLGVVEGASQPLQESLTTYLHEKQMLLLLDNFEQILAAASLVTELLAHSPGLKVLVTSRALLRVSGEYAYVVPPLDRPASTEDDSEALTQYAAVRLFMTRAQAVKPTFALTPVNAGAVAEICRRLDGLPLAIELAAARSNLLSPQMMLSRPGHRLQLLQGGAQDLPARQQTLRATIEWSYMLLRAAEQTLMRRLGVFVGGWTLEAAETVCDPAGELDVLESMAALVDNSLVRQVEESPASYPGQVRFTMLETLREYALERLEASGEAEQIRQHHAAYYLALTETADRPIERGPDQGVWLDRLAAEHDNLRAVLAWSQRGPDGADIGVRLAGTLGLFCQRRGHFNEGLLWLERTLARSNGSAAQDASRARALCRAGWLTHYRQEYRAAAALFEQSLALCRQVLDTDGAAFALVGLGYCAYAQGDYERARSQAEASLHLAQREGNRFIMSHGLQTLGFVRLAQGDLRHAMVCLEASQALARAAGNTHVLATTLCHMGHVAHVQGAETEATTLYTQSLDLFRTMGYHGSVAQLLLNLGCVARGQGDWRRAAACYRECLILGQEYGHTGWSAHALVALAGLIGTSPQGQARACQAARLFGTVDALPNACLTPLTPLETPRVLTDYNRDLAAVRAHLDDATFARAWAEGRAMRLEKAVAYALTDDAERRAVGKQ